MKKVLLISCLILSISLFLSTTKSFSTAEIRNDATLTISPENHALIAIHYGEENNFTIKNNTGQKIKIESMNLINDPDIVFAKEVENSVFINPGEVKEYIFTQDLKDLSGKVIQIKVDWNGGSAEIKTTIPVQKQ